jgi:hypothetical protein
MTVTVAAARPIRKTGCQTRVAMLKKNPAANHHRFATASRKQSRKSSIGILSRGPYVACLMKP